MSKPESDPHPPRVSLVTLGQEDHGKTTLTAAITRVLAKSGGATFLSYEALNTLPEERDGLTRPIAHVEYETKHRRYTHADCPRHDDHVKGLISGEVRVDGAILVVSAAAGPMPQTREHLQLARHVGVPALVVFLNKVDLLDDPELREFVEREVRDLLTTYGFPGDTLPVIAGSARKALEGDTSEIGELAILELLEAVDRSIPTRDGDGDAAGHRGTGESGRPPRPRGRTQHPRGDGEGTALCRIRKAEGGSGDRGRASPLALLLRTAGLARNREQSHQGTHETQPRGHPERAPRAREEVRAGAATQPAQQWQ